LLISFFFTAAFKTHNVPIHTADNETLGAWFTFADPFYATHKAHLLGPSGGPTSNLSSPRDSRDDLIRAALRAHPTILFLHGTTGTRAMRIRVQHYLAFAARLRANVLAPDYRGFADSTGTPSEAGVVLDARAAWDWLRVRGAPPASVLVVGSSLGTGVAVQFASALEEEAVRAEDAGDKKMKNGVASWVRPAPAAVRERPRGVVLLSPFSKLETLLDTYYILGLVPLFAPLRTIPYLASECPLSQIAMSHEQKKIDWLVGAKKDFIKGFMIHRFDSLAKVVVRTVLVLSKASSHDFQGGERGFVNASLEWDDALRLPTYAHTPMSRPPAGMPSPHTGVSGCSAGFVLTR